MDLTLAPNPLHNAWQILSVDKVATLLVEQVAKVLRTTPEKIDRDRSIYDLGMDSLMSVTLQRQLSGSLGVPLPAALIYEYPTISSLTEALCERMGLATDEAGQAPVRSGLAARAQKRAMARQGAAANRRKGHVV